MAAAKKKPKIQATEIEVGKRTLEGVLIDLAERSKENADRAARAEEMAAIALKTIASVTQDLRALTQEFREMNARSDARLRELEQQRGA